MYLVFVVGQELLIALFSSLGLAAYIRVSGLVWPGVCVCGVCMHACVCVRVSVCAYHCVLLFAAPGLVC